MSGLSKAERRRKLPKWAQDEIAVLEMRVRELRETLAEGPDDSNTFANPYSGTPRPLGTDTSIAFYPGENPRASLLVRLRDGALEILATGGRVSVWPQASNVVSVRMEDP